MQKTTQQFDRSIIDGPIGRAVWRLAWPTMLQNVIAGLQGIIDHVPTSRVFHDVDDAGMMSLWILPRHR